MKDIDPKTLKLLRTNANLSQQDLAEISGVSKKTIARIEGGKSCANNTTVNRLAKALQVSDQELAKPSEQQFFHAAGWGRISPYVIHDNARLAMQMIEKCYGICIPTQLSLAPLMAALLAEGSLVWRRQKLSKAEEAANALREADYGHLGFCLGVGDVEEYAPYESDSIEQRDISGKKVIDKVLESSGAMPGDINPFVEYLCYFARQLSDENGSDLIKVLPGPRHDDEESPDGKWLANPIHQDHCVYFSIDENELNRLVGNSEWAKRALQWGYVKISDIPKELLGDDVKEERMKWFESQIPEAQRAEYEAFLDGLSINLEAENES